MNILLVVNGLPDEHNPARSVYNIKFAQELILNNVEVTIVHLRSFHFKRFFIRERKYDNIKIFEIPSYIPIGRLFYFPILVYLFSLNKFQFDLIHVIDGGGVVTGNILSKAFKVPVICQFIGSDVNIYLSNRRNKRSYINALSSYKLLTFNSKALQDKFSDLIKVDMPVKVIYRGIDLRNYVMIDNPVEKRKISFLYLGGFIGKDGNSKGGVTLLNALKHLDHVQHSNHLFMIGGPNSINFQNSYKFSYINVKFIGAIHRDKVQHFIKQSNVIIIPSLNEGVPNVLYEAMANTKFVIATKVGGIPEILTVDCGILIDPNSINNLKAELENTCNFKYDINFLSKCAYFQVQQFQYKYFISNYLYIYRNLINTTSPSI